MNTFNNSTNNDGCPCQIDEEGYKKLYGGSGSVVTDITKSKSQFKIIDCSDSKKFYNEEEEKK